MSKKPRDPEHRRRPEPDAAAPDPHDGLHVAHELQRDGGPALPGEVRDRTHPPRPEASGEDP